MKAKINPAPIIARARYRSPINIRYSIFHCHSKDKGVIEISEIKVQSSFYAFQLIVWFSSLSLGNNGRYL